MKEYLDTGLDIGKLFIVILMTGALAFILSITWKYSSYALYDEIKSLSVKQSIDIQESRNREELLYKECKNLDYLVDVLAQSYLEEKKV